jgi:mannose-6-phosphate isomerase-like protein (cupin superfamily)
MTSHGIKRVAGERHQPETHLIPFGRVHALENLGSIPLERVEVQSGSCLGEDGIVRFDDQYGRV